VVEGLRVFAGSGEPMVLLGLGGSDAWGAILAASGVAGFLVLRVSSPFYGSIVEELGLMSCSALRKLRS
jgi:hypothetical protein